ncbi:MAG TPA: competence/damage-inducible protein A [Gammaproteobacteria bacterium]|jgi:molybdenum cofactor synthesis domain-containing protein|nr:competence/damage-inducible protein A [Pseudomonadota bacterium]HAY46381.1 competence/damage-inducible protein A [Gammaproteobacteria bacterium]
MKDQISAALVLIGNEILSGRTQDANLKYIADSLGKVGIVLLEARVIPDVHDTIISTLRVLKTQFDYVFTTGGIGPTHDDITSECVASAVYQPLELHPVAFKAMDDYYREKGIEFNDARQRMAKTPRGATLIESTASIAPGYVADNIIVMAGVPRIMQRMLSDVIPTLNHGVITTSRQLHTNLPEGVLAQPLTELQSRYPQIDIGSYPQMTNGRGFHVILVYRSTDIEALEALDKDLKNMITSAGGEYDLDAKPAPNA